MIRYSVWLDQATDTYEVVRWIGKDSHEVVQRNILTIEKAYRAGGTSGRRARRVKMQMLEHQSKEDTKEMIRRGRERDARQHPDPAQ